MPRLPEHSVAVFSGGGARGAALGGVFRALRDQAGVDWGQRCPPLRCAAGCSVGSLAALCTVLGLSAHEMEELTQTMQLSKLVDLSPLRLVQGGMGLDDGSTLRAFVAGLLMQRLELDAEGAARLTLGELAARKGMELLVVATDLERDRLLTLSSSATPRVPVVQAVAASMALPPVFEPVTVTGLGADGGGTVLAADGGILDSFPIGEFKAEEVIGVRLLQGRAESMQELQASRLPIAPFLSHVLRISSSVADAVAWHGLTAEGRRRVIDVKCGRVSAFALTLDRDTRAALVQAGVEGVIAALQRWDTGEGVPTPDVQALPMGVRQALR